MKWTLASLFSLWLPLAALTPPITDYFDKGKEIMQVYEKPALLCFLSSDGCMWSRHFFDEVLNQPKFLEEMHNECIFIVLDFPDFKRQSKEQIERNENLKMLYRVESFPTFVMVAEEGEEITRLSFFSGNHEEFSRKLLLLQREYFSLKKACQDLSFLSFSEDIKELYKKALSLGCPSLIAQILEQGLLCDHPGFFLIEKLMALCTTKEGKQSEEAKTLREQIHKLKGDELERAKFRMAVSDFQDLQKESPHLAEGVISRFLLTQPKDKEAVYQLNFLLATHFLEQKDFALARHYAKEMGLFAHNPHTKADMEKLSEEIERREKED